MLLADLVACANEVAVARVARVPAVPVRRALMLVGDLGETAGIALSQGQPGLEPVGFQTLRPVRPMLASTDAAAEADEADTIAAVRGLLLGGAGSIGSQP